MDVLIKNMEMPKGDIPLVLIIASDGTVEEIDDSDEINKTDAKAIEIPPHGSLIDTEEAIDHWDASMMIIDRYSMCEFLNRIPIVLEASK